MVFAAFLRGINVGGHRKVEMARLKKTFEGLGFRSVKTLIASGNVVFEAGAANPAALTRKIQMAIHQDFGFEVQVLLRDSAEMKKLVKSIPAGWVNDSGIKCDVMLLWDGADRKEVLKEIPFDPALEEVRYVPGAVLWCIPRKRLPRSKMGRLVGTKLHQQMTVRNPNTIRKIGQLMDQTAA
jgi:uncharacterized protein (DUF1697 family)